MSNTISIEEIKRRLAVQEVEVAPDATDDQVRELARHAWPPYGSESHEKYSEESYPKWIEREEIARKTSAGLRFDQAVRVILRQAYEDAGL